MRSPGTRKEDWIGNQLRKVYDVALTDAIPQDMLDLLSALDESEEQDRVDAESSHDQRDGGHE
jgi:hypothetical protein